MGVRFKSPKPPFQTFCISRLVHVRTLEEPRLRSRVRILNIYHSIELFLKARLLQAHPLLIYRSLTIEPFLTVDSKANAYLLILGREKCRTTLLDSISVRLSGTKDSTSATSTRSNRPLTRRGP